MKNRLKYIGSNNGRRLSKNIGLRHMCSTVPDNHLYSEQWNIFLTSYRMLFSCDSKYIHKMINRRTCKSVKAFKRHLRKMSGFVKSGCTFALTNKHANYMIFGKVL